VCSSDLTDPGWFKNPLGKQAYEYKGELPKMSKMNGTGNPLMSSKAKIKTTQFTAVKPNYRKS
jgi:hypothetical protein